MEPLVIDVLAKIWSPVRFRRARLKGISLAEVVIVVCVLGILAAVAIPMAGHVFSGTSEATALKNLNFLNGAVLAFNQSNHELDLAPASDSSDELTIFQSLSYRDPVHPSPGSPYLPATTVFVESSATDTYRAEWNGKMFQMVDTGASGTGIDLLKMVQ